MTGQPPDVRTILDQRMALIPAIAAANCEHLRLNQIASGMMILDQKAEEDGASEAPHDADRTANDEALDASMTLITALEAELAELDRHLAAAIERDEK